LIVKENNQKQRSRGERRRQRELETQKKRENAEVLRKEEKFEKSQMIE